MTARIDWIALFIEDRTSMANLMRENICTDVKYGRGSLWAFKEMMKVEEYEKETERLLKKFTDARNGQQLAYYHLKKVGAIA